MFEDVNVLLAYLGGCKKNEMFGETVCGVLKKKNKHLY